VKKLSCWRGEKQRRSGRERKKVRKKKASGRRGNEIKGKIITFSKPLDYSQEDMKEIGEVL